MKGMNDFEPTFCDIQPLEERVAALSFSFSRDIFKPQGFLKKTAIKGDVLDLGCGRGAVGPFLKGVNPEINLTGVDSVNYF
ncbi:hypothetical protein COT64_03575 [Candidatus Shapirobacteria bacterium CG09_land_8_20_14_0_10_39_12]|uniref:Methyltransferase small domain-containing protein n=1 Tax=Candidatus Shapirobacteria bacterium CG09_land_8_20_14_0_10_39_12 TaxID=1974885 RepID=A0A2H0WNQ3_9BACT|nr:MAG: hypothetical protein COT64_03575 [Candidatus Shapirobacteria bacterium CG09_land_8_20_14_0_10_39_12]